MIAAIGRGCPRRPIVVNGERRPERVLRRIGGEPGRCRHDSFNRVCFTAEVHRTANDAGV